MAKDITPYGPAFSDDICVLRLATEEEVRDQCRRDGGGSWTWPAAVCPGDLRAVMLETVEDEVFVRARRLPRPSLDLAIDDGSWKPLPVPQLVHVPGTLVGELPPGVMALCRGVEVRPEDLSRGPQLAKAALLGRAAATEVRLLGAVAAVMFSWLLSISRYALKQPTDPFDRLLAEALRVADGAAPEQEVIAVALVVATTMPEWLVHVDHQAA
jgi:hypothetical protein